MKSSNKYLLKTIFFVALVSVILHAIISDIITSVLLNYIICVIFGFALFCLILKNYEV